MFKIVTYSLLTILIPKNTFPNEPYPIFYLIEKNNFHSKSRTGFEQPC